MKSGITSELTREEVEEVLTRWVRQQLGQDYGKSVKEMAGARVQFFGENKYLNQQPKEARCRECGSTALAPTRRLPFDRAVVTLLKERNDDS